MRVTSSEPITIGSGLPLGLRSVALAVAGLSALGLGAALAIEHIGGIRPCPLCLDQRIAYYAAIPLALLAATLAGTRPSWSRVILAVLALGFAVNAGLGIYHAGIEWSWWPGPDACSGIAPIATTPGALLDSLANSRVVRCDEAAIRIIGISLAGYSALLSAFLAILSLLGAARIFTRP